MPGISKHKKGLKQRSEAGSRAALTSKAEKNCRAVLSLAKSAILAFKTVRSVEDKEKMCNIVERAGAALQLAVHAGAKQSCPDLLLQAEQALNGAMLAYCAASSVLSQVSGSHRSAKAVAEQLEHHWNISSERQQEYVADARKFVLLRKAYEESLGQDLLLCLLHQPLVQEHFQHMLPEYGPHSRFIRCSRCLAQLHSSHFLLHHTCSKEHCKELSWEHMLQLKLVSQEPSSNSNIGSCSGTDVSTCSSSVSTITCITVSSSNSTTHSLQAAQTEELTSSIEHATAESRCAPKFNCRLCAKPLAPRQQHTCSGRFWRDILIDQSQLPHCSPSEALHVVLQQHFLTKLRQECTLPTAIVTRWPPRWLPRRLTSQQEQQRMVQAGSWPLAAFMAYTGPSKMVEGERGLYTMFDLDHSGTACNPDSRIMQELAAFEATVAQGHRQAPVLNQFLVGSYTGVLERGRVESLPPEPPGLLMRITVVDNEVHYQPGLVGGVACLINQGHKEAELLKVDSGIRYPTFLSSQSSRQSSRHASAGCHQHSSSEAQCSKTKRTWVFGQRQMVLYAKINHAPVEGVPGYGQEQVEIAVPSATGSKVAKQRVFERFRLGSAGSELTWQYNAVSYMAAGADVLTQMPCCCSYCLSLAPEKQHKLVSERPAKKQRVAVES